MSRAADAAAPAEGAPGVHVLAVSIRRPAEEVYAFLAEPRNFPRWASGLADGLTQAGDEWAADGPAGPVRVRFTPSNAYGVADHLVRLDSGEEVSVPLRVVAQGAGSLVTLTLFRQAGHTDATFEADRQWVARDLQRLRALFEPT
ncbi:SRPBCC family protein [Bordetella genomosp. 1]|uniref:Polyketide cyclase n=1 Tax=Bordetella genomosp. 1 TaxID=1395607 RepID=A0ABX4EWX1_9BORD|nr:SRPBCC family protein [Bordetella genomosp. 1]OZI58617.1 polyketide cyclase [Bordetella genomosp. 1]